MGSKMSERHLRNKHKGRYDFDVLTNAHSDLEQYIVVNKYGNSTISFFDPLAVKALNTALLKSHYGIEYWDFPKGALCPPIPGRADYIHYLSDLLFDGKSPNIKIGDRVKVLDIGTGASLIYPIIGHMEYGWSFVGTEIYDKSISSAKTIIEKNGLSKKIEIRKQDDAFAIFKNLVVEYEYFDALICNPPFYSTEKEAIAANTRKNTNLGNKDTHQRNFGGMQNELWCHGGELNFVKRVINESADHPSLCFWYTTLVSRDEYLDELIEKIDYYDPTEVKIIDLSHGNKKSRVLCWTFLTKKQRKAWIDLRDR